MCQRVAGLGGKNEVQARKKDLFNVFMPVYARKLLLGA